MRTLLRLLLAALLVPVACTDPAGVPATSDDGMAGGGDDVPLVEDHSVAAVYTSDNDKDGVRQLFVAARSGRMQNLSYPLGATCHVTMHAVSPDRLWVAFAVLDGPDSGLYVTPIHLPDPARVLPAGAFEVLEIAWKPDSTRIALRARLDGGPQKGYLVSPDGTGFTDLGGPVGEVRAPLRWFAGLLAFHSDRATAGQHEVYVWDGAAAQRISRTLAAAGTVRFVRFNWSPAAACLAFLADDDAAGVFELYVWDGVRVTRVSDAGGIVGEDWKWTPDGSALVYRRDGVLYRVSKGGGDARRISGDPGGGVTAYEPGPAGAIAFLVDGKELYTTDGIDPPVEVAQAAGLIRDFSWSPSGASLAYRATDEDPPPLLPELLLYMVDATGAAPPVLVLADDTAAYAWSVAPPSPLAVNADEEGLFAIDSWGRHTNSRGDRLVQVETRRDDFHYGRVHVRLEVDEDEPVTGTVTRSFHGGVNESYFTGLLRYYRPDFATGPTIRLGVDVDPDDVTVVDGLGLPALSLGRTTIYGQYIGEYSGGFQRPLVLTVDLGAARFSYVERDPRGAGFVNRGSGPCSPPGTCEAPEAGGPGSVTAEVDADGTIVGGSVAVHSDRNDPGSKQDAKLLPDPIEAMVNIARLPLRAQPHDDGEERARIPGGERITIEGRSADDENWYLVRRGDEHEGWVDRRFVLLLGTATRDAITNCAPRFADDVQLDSPRGPR